MNNTRALRTLHKLYGFTLVELLVVIGIIGVLVSILLPTLGRARNAAISVACQANLRGIGQAMVIYVSENKGWIPGSAMTTGRHLFDIGGTSTSPTFALKTGINISNSPGVIDIQDYIGPLSRIMRVKLINSEQGNVDVTESVEVTGRWRAYRNLKQFQCPAARNTIAREFTGTGVGAGPILSYATATNFLLVSRGSITTNGGMSGSVFTPGSPYWILPANYQPKITKIGQTSEKIYMADAARWSDGTNQPSFSIGGIGPIGGSSWQNTTPFADFGAFTGTTKSYGRWNTPAAGLTARVFDGKLAAFRHGERRPNINGGNYRMNALFFDGHVETLNEDQATSPKQWLPRNTRFPSTNVETFGGNGQWMIWPDTRTRLGIPTTAYLVP